MKNEDIERALKLVEANGALGTARLFFDAPTVSVKGVEHQLNDQYAGTDPLPSWTEAINAKDNAPF